MSQVFEQTGAHVHLELVKSDLACSFAFLIRQVQALPGKHLNRSRRRLNGPVLLWLPTILVIVHSDAQWQLLVIVAKFSHKERVGLPPGV